MRFQSLYMKDFRGIRTLIVDFEPDLTVIVGRNGAGKTSILDALGELSRFIRAHLKQGPRRVMSQQLSSRDVRSQASEFLLSLKLDPGDGWSDSGDRDLLHLKWDVDAGDYDWNFLNKLMQWSDQAKAQPRFVYYRQNRAFQKETRSTAREPDRTLDPEYVQALSLAEDLQAIGDLEAWWNERDAQEARVVRDSDPKYRDPQLEAIRKLVTRIDEFTGINYSSTASPPGLRLLKSDGTAIHVSGLSAGERSYIILLADLARRLQVFAPEQPLEEIPAIVLIDEVELNLHPAWQSQIAPTLTKVFKACQFIVTTHSPQVLSGIENRNVRVLRQTASGPTEATVPLSTRGRTSNYLLEGVLGASERFPPIDKLVEDFNDAIDGKDSVTAVKKLAKLEKELADDTPTLLVLRKRLRRLRGNE